MKYLFFDIECACVYKHTAKICAFGYVLTDEQYHVLERRDILINPKGKFHLTDRKGGEGLVLPYAYEDFKQYPIFPEVYPEIRQLLEAEDTVVLGHATLNDVNYLNLETRRYRLPSFKFSYYDTQFFYMNTEGDYTRQSGLGGMAEALGVEFIPHRAVDDAYATMRVCEALCKREKTHVLGLVSRYQIKPGKLAGGRITLLSSKGQRDYLKRREEERAERAKAHEAFFRFVNKNMHKRTRGGSLDGKVFCFAKDIEDDVSVSVKLVGAIFASGGKYTSHPAQCNVYIARGEGGLRYQNALSGGAAFIPLDSITQALEASCSSPQNI